MPEYAYPGDAIALQQVGITPRLCSCDRSVDAPHSSQCPFWQDVLAARTAWVQKLWLTDVIEAKESPRWFLFMEHLERILGLTYDSFSSKPREAVIAEAVEYLCTKPDTLVRWMTAHTWRCACKAPADLNSAGAYACQDCGTWRPRKKDPSK